MPCDCHEEQLPTTLNKKVSSGWTGQLLPLHWPSKKLWSTARCMTQAMLSNSHHTLLFWVLVPETAQNMLPALPRAMERTTPPGDSVCNPQRHPLRWQICRGSGQFLYKGQVLHRVVLGCLYICLPSRTLSPSSYCNHVLTKFSHR